MDREQCNLRTRSVSAALLLLVALAPRLALAQEPAHSLQDLQPRLSIGDTIRVADFEGKTTEGKFDGLTDSSLQLKVEGKTREFPGTSLREIELKYRDPISNGLLAGAIVGVAAGAVFGLSGVAPEGCESSQCRLETTALWGAIGGGIGAASGALVDSKRKGYLKIFSAPETSGNRWGISPILLRETKGMKISLRF
jgi:hypothetical protein